MLYLRRQSHLIERSEHSMNAPARNTMFADTTQDTFMFGGQPAWNSGPMPCAPPTSDWNRSMNQYIGQTSHSAYPQAYAGPGREDSDEDGDHTDDDIPEELITWEDTVGLPPAEADESIFLQYRFAKKRWKRQFGGRKGGKGFRRKFRKGGKGGHFEASFDQGAGTYAFDRKNPMGRDGKIMKCSICESDSHLRVRNSNQRL